MQELQRQEQARRDQREWQMFRIFFIVVILLNLIGFVLIAAKLLGFI